jgi:ABC-type Zn2+ transport system substrate-binding protein/surface adhesin
MRRESEHKRDASEHHHARDHKHEHGSDKGKHHNGSEHHDDHDDHHEGLEPKLTLEDLQKHRGVIFTGPDGREYQAELPGSWSNAKVAAEAVDKVCHECRDSPHFDTEGYGTNRELGRRIQEAFTELKAGKGFLVAWRIYPEKDHPRWQVADGCGCGCSCGGGEEPARNPRAKHKGGKKAAKPSKGQKHNNR